MSAPRCVLKSAEGLLALAHSDSLHRRESQFGNQGQVVGGDTRQFRSGDFYFRDLEPWADKYVVDTNRGETPGIGVFGPVTPRFGLYVLEPPRNLAAHRR